MKAETGALFGRLPDSAPCRGVTAPESAQVAAWALSHSLRLWKQLLYWEIQLLGQRSHG